MITLALILQADARQLSGHQATNLIRMSDKTDLRPQLDLPALEATTPEEQFQNQTLRPVLKLQNDLYLSFSQEYVLKQRKDYKTLTPADQRNYLAGSLQKDAVLKNTLIGMTLGMLTAEELTTYFLNPGNYNRRMSAMITERVLSQI